MSTLFPSNLFFSFLIYALITPITIHSQYSCSNPAPFNSAITNTYAGGPYRTIASLNCPNGNLANFRYANVQKQDSNNFYWRVIDQNGNVKVWGSNTANSCAYLNYIIGGTTGLGFQILCQGNSCLVKFEVQMECAPFDSSRNRCLFGTPSCPNNYSPSVPFGSTNILNMPCCNDMTSPNYDNTLATCSCGQICPTNIGLTCNDKGTCNGNNGLCVCNGGWYGASCNSNVNPCDGNTCNGHGTCSSLTGSCACTGGWSGSSCSVSPPTSAPAPSPINACIQNSNCFYGNCIGYGSTAYCSCQNNYYGSTCDTYSAPSVYTPEKSSSTTSPAILGGAASGGAVILIIFIILGVVYYRRKKQATNTKLPPDVVSIIIRDLSPNCPVASICISNIVTDNNDLGEGLSPRQIHQHKTSYSGNPMLESIPSSPNALSRSNFYPSIAQGEL